MPSWTNEQKDAIIKSGTNIIVSAGAGSGKTTVLTARVVEKLKSGININNLLILTFTNKAAQEMKERIREAIKENEEISSQLDYIDSSYITTFDSFALSMVKRYSYLLNLGKNIAIADPSSIYLEKKKIINEVFDNLYTSKNPLFFKLLDNFTIKKDDDIKSYILAINNKLDLKYDKLLYLDNYIDSYYSEENINLLINFYIALLKDKLYEIESLITYLSNYVDSDYIDSLNKSLSGLLSSNTYEEIRANSSVTLPRLPSGCEDIAKNSKENIKKVIDSLKNLTELESIGELKESLLSTKDYVEIIIEIIKEIDKKINLYKFNNNTFDFVDIAKMSISILKNNENIRLELRDSFKEIMIDEYQDTSDLQELFITLIQNNNVYVVGDIKQSIYRFRNANPYLFKDKYDRYGVNDGGIKIDLTKNFRSREEVVNNINLMFSSLMTDSCGGADYKNSHIMIFGNDDYHKYGELNISSDFEIFNYQYDKDTNFTKDEIEIFFIAQDIKNKVENKYQVYDRKTKGLRDVTYKDFAILLSDRTSFDLYKNIFEYFNIPVTKYSKINLIEKDEIVLIKNIIKLLINRLNKVYDVEFKYCLTSVLRSYLFEYSDQEIFNIITNNKFDCDLIKTIDLIVDNLNSLSLKEIIYEIIDKFNFYQKFILVGDVKNRIDRLNSIINLFNNLSSLNYTLEDAYNSLNELILDSFKIEVEELDVISNSVTLMTIHGSKGLEFPICYFASLHKNFNIKELNERFLYDNKYGIIAPYFNEGIGTTFVKELVKNRYLNEEISEKIRLFYVAVTRAKEKFIMVTSFKDKGVTDISKSKSFLDFLSYIKSSLSPYIKEISLDKLNLTHNYNLVKEYNYKDNILKTNDKITISEVSILNDTVNSSKISKETHELLDKNTKDKMKFGTFIHEALELLDFKNPNYSLLDLDNFYIEKIKHFISLLDLNDVDIYKEYEFSYQEDNTTYHGIIDLILEYKDKIMIIDYKLNNIKDDNYIKQLESYKKYISKKSNKKIDIYLFSIISGTLEKLL